MVYVSITGMELLSEAHAPEFWSYARPSMEQAKAAPGNIYAAGAKIQETFHTLSIWENRASMQQFRQSGDHVKAMQIYDTIARTGKVYGYETETIVVPTWTEVRRIYDAKGRTVVGNRATEGGAAALRDEEEVLARKRTKMADMSEDKSEEMLVH